MNSQLFFILNFVIGGLFLIWFLSARKGGGSGPTRLRLTERAQQGPPSAPKAGPPVERGGRAPGPAPEPEPEPDRPAPKNLNVLFLYNGHDWDAYAILGLPAGASLPVVTAKYQELIQSADQGKSEFYEAAYRAILHRT